MTLRSMMETLLARPSEHCQSMYAAHRGSRKRIWLAVWTGAMLLLACGQAAWATPVTAEDAWIAVQNWVDRDPTPLGASLGATVSGVETFTDEQLRPVYYVVYLEPSGFVIVSGDDEVEPIIAFSPEGTYDPTTDNPLVALVAGNLPLLSGR